MKAEVNSIWAKIPLSDVLKKSDRWIRIQPNETYKQITVRLWGKGVILRGQVTGAEIAASEMLQVQPNQFILSRIDARNGASGLIPEFLKGAVVTNDFPVYDIDTIRLHPAYLGWMSKTRDFVDFCRAASEGTTNRVRLKEGRFLATAIKLPPLEEQRRIVVKIDELTGKINQSNKLKNDINNTSHQLLQSSFAKITANAKFIPMHEVAPITRRPVNIDLFSEYPELGIRSFGNGTFHKPALSGAAVGSKKLFRIEPGGVVFNNVFAWEGAVAVAKAEDFGRFGSHRFITCLPKKGLATPEFLCFYFLTSKGLEKLGEASPGGAGRNRTLGLDALSKIEVPVPPIDQQLWFDSLQNKMESLKKHQEQTSTQLDALLPSILDKAFKGEL